MAKAACAEEGWDAFFGVEDEEGPGKHRPLMTRKASQYAKRICAQCPVQQECLDYALKNEETYGIWGGFTPRERQRLSRQSVSRKVCFQEQEIQADSA